MAHKVHQPFADINLSSESWHVADPIGVAVTICDTGRDNRMEPDMPDTHRVPDRDEDLYAWTLHQAEMLAQGTAACRQLDLNGLHEFLEEAAEEMLSKVASQMVNLMAHAAKVAFTGNPEVIGHWRSECVEFHDQVVDAYRKSMRQRIDMEGLWHRAKRKVRASFADHDEPEPNLPEACPFTVEFLVDPDLDIEELITVVRHEGSGIRHQ